MAEQFTNKAQTTLNGAIDSDDTSIVVTSATGFPTTGNFRILIKAEGANTDEICTVTGVSGTTFTVTRASEAISGTQAASAHASGAEVIHILTAGALKTLYDLIGVGADMEVVGTMSANGSSPLTLTKPAGTQDGDFLLIACQTANSVPNASGPNGDSTWTNLITYDTSSSEYQVVWYKIASSEGSSWTLSHSVGSDAAAAGVVLRGVNDIWFMQWNADTFTAPQGLGHPSGVAVIIYMTTTGGTSAILAPVGDGITTDVDSTYSGGNYSTVTIAHRLTTAMWDCPSLRGGGPRTADTYTMAITLVLYDNGA